MNKRLSVILAILMVMAFSLFAVSSSTPEDNEEITFDEVESVTTEFVEESTTNLSTTEKSETVQETEEETTTKATTTEKETSTKKATTTAKPTTTKKVTTTAKPTTTKKVTTTARPTTTKKVTEDPESSYRVYRTKSGEKYHYENPCGNGTYYEISLSEAKASGLEPCEKCVLH